MDRQRPVRVLFLHPSNELYGADRSLLYLLRGLDQRYFHPLVLIGNDLEYEGALSRELDLSGIENRPFPLAVARRKYMTPSGLPGFLTRCRTSARQVSDLIRSEQIDVVHTNTLAVWTGALAARQAGRPHAWHVQEQLERPRPLVKLMQHFVPSHSAGVVGVSQAVLENILVTPEARAKGRVIYNMTETQVYMRATGRERIRAELGVGSNAVLIGVVARISRMKGTDLCVEAVSRLMASDPRVHCFIAGGPVPGQQEVIDRVQQLISSSPAPERFHMLGVRRDVPDLMAAMDILAAPSRYGEGASLTVIQAMAAGRPVVATDLGGNKELVVHGETGWIVPRENVGELAQALYFLVNDAPRRAAMGAAGQRRAVAQFSVEHAAQQFNAFLYELYMRSNAQAPVGAAVGRRA